jgi:hypothetical protein
MIVPLTPTLRIRMAGSHDEAPQNAPSRVKPKKAQPKLHFSSLIIAGSTTPSDEKVEAVIVNSTRLSAASSSQERQGMVFDMGASMLKRSLPRRRFRRRGKR